jgi:hypothetical protein
LWTLKRPTSARWTVARPTALVGDPQALLVLLDTRRADVGGRIRAVGQDPRAGLLGDADERAGRRVVGVDDPGGRPGERLGASAPPARELLEQLQLGVAVRLPRPVQLEVLVGQVGQDRDVVGDRIDAVEGQACEVVSMTGSRIAGRPCMPGRAR